MGSLREEMRRKADAPIAAHMPQTQLPTNKHELVENCGTHLDGERPSYNPITTPKPAALIPLFASSCGKCAKVRRFVCALGRVQERHVSELFSSAPANVEAHVQRLVSWHRLVEDRWGERDSHLVIQAGKFLNPCAAEAMAPL